MTSSGAAGLAFLSAGAAQGLVEALRAAFEADSGWSMQGRFGAVGAMKEALLGGAEPCDLFISTDVMVRQLIQTGQLAAGSAVPIGLVPTGVAVRAGDAAPVVNTPEALRAAVEKASALYFPDPERATAGIHFARVIEQLGLTALTRPRWKCFPNGATAMREMATSGPPGALGCTQWTEILITPGVQAVALLPEPLGLSTMYTAAVSARAQQPEAAQRFARQLGDAAHGALRERCGFQAV
jgi:molybdate transport system substrate-binding protein